MERRGDNSATAKPPCTQCGGPVMRWGKDANGHQRFRCTPCGSTFAERPRRPLGSMRLPADRAVLCVSMLVEGMSIRSVERITGHHRDTICRLVVTMGGKCQAILDALVRNVAVSNVEADEIWGFCRMKAKTQKRKGLQHDQEIGDTWTFVAIDGDSKLVLAHQLGKRDVYSADDFMRKLDTATDGHFQLTTDGLDVYPDLVVHHLGTRVDYAQLIKQYGTDSAEDQRRYSPARIIGAEKRPVHGRPVEAAICTSYVERQNLTMRMSMRRLTRLTNGFSKKWGNLRAALALHFAHYNLCRIHSTIRCTPAMAAGVSSTLWSVADLVNA